MELLLSKGEMLLLDWVLHFPMPSGYTDIDWHMGWRDLRMNLWHQISSTDNTSSAVVWVERDNVHVLLALVPTTFVWSTGEDVGYSLKVKLAAALEKVLEKEKGES